MLDQITLAFSTLDMKLVLLDIDDDFVQIQPLKEYIDIAVEGLASCTGGLDDDIAVLALLQKFIRDIDSHGRYDAKARVIVKKIFSILNCSSVYMHATESATAVSLANEGYDSFIR
jgi:hypothetical protein